MKRASILIFLATLFFGPSFAFAESTSTSTTSTAALVLALEPEATASSTPLSEATTTPIISFRSATTTVLSGTETGFLFELQENSLYRISFECPLGITAFSREGDLCKTGSDIAVGTTTFPVTFENEATTDQKVVAILSAHDASTTVITSKQASIVVSPPVSLRATITSFSVEQNIGSTVASSALSFTARFTGKNIDTYRIRLGCPVPTTIAGIRERLHSIETGGAGLTSTIQEGRQCNVTQTVSASSGLFALKLDNPFKTAQALEFTLQAYSWDGKKDLFGEERSHVIVVDSK